MQDWKRNIAPDALPEQYRKFADTLGIETAIAICEQFGGEVLYIPTTRDIINNVRNPELLRRYNAGESPKALCEEYGIGRTTFYRIIKREIKGRGRK